MSSNPSALLSELLRPKMLAELTADPAIVARLTRMVQTGSTMNMLFYGRPGTGKTSAARIIIKQLEAVHLPLNGSSNNRDKNFNKCIEDFASTGSLFPDKKICFIDEADHMTKSTQASLRYTIEKFSGYARFILTANDLRRVDPAIQSRCIPLCFDVSIGRRREVIDGLIAKYQRQLTAIGHDLDPDRIRNIVVNYFPDLRAIANNFQMEILNGEPIAAVAA